MQIYLIFFSGGSLLPGHTVQMVCLYEVAWFFFSPIIIFDFIPPQARVFNAHSEILIRAENPDLRFFTCFIQIRIFLRLIQFLLQYDMRLFFKCNDYIRKLWLYYKYVWFSILISFNNVHLLYYFLFRRRMITC